MQSLLAPNVFTGPAEPSLQLPVELWEHSLDHLWDDPTSLKACSLTCRIWLPVTRLHLFRSIALSQSNYARFCKFVRNSEVSRFFRELSITGKDDTMCLVLLQLPAVTHLTLSLWVVRATRPDVQAVLYKSLQSLTTLVLQKIIFSVAQPSLEFLRVICSYPRLTALTIQDLHVSGKWKPSACSSLSADLAAIARRQPLVIRDLTVRDCAEAPLAWLLDLNIAPKLRRVAVKWGSLEMLQYIEPLLRTATSLEHLIVGYWPGDSGPDDGDSRPLTVAESKHLRSICFHPLFFFGSQPNTSPPAYKWMLSILSSISSPVLSTITFWMTCSRIGNLDAFRWKELDDIVATLATGCPQLELHFEVNGHRVPLASVHAAITERLSKSSAAGVRSIVALGRPYVLYPSWP